MYTLLYTSVSEVCLPFYIPTALKRYPFQGEPPHVGHHKDSPPLVLGKQRQKLSLNCSDFLGELLVVYSTRRFVVGGILNTNAKLLIKSHDCCNRFQHPSHRINVTGWMDYTACTLRLLEQGNFSRGYCSHASSSCSQ